MVMPPHVQVWSCCLIWQILTLGHDGALTRRSLIWSCCLIWQILTLGHDGALTLSYLGTDPPPSSVAVEAKELNYEAMDEEHRRLLQVI